MTRRCRGRTAALAVLLAVCHALAADAVLTRFAFVDEDRVAQVETLTEDGGAYFRLSDIALAVSGIRYWNPRTGKMTLSVGDHLIAMNSDSRFAALDRSVENLRAPAVTRRGVFWVPSGFVTGVLASALNADIEWVPDEKAVTITRLRPAVESLSLRSTVDGTVVDMGLTGSVDFTARSRTRAAIEVLMPGARLPDSLGVAVGTDHVSAVLVEESPEGVRAEIVLTDRAGSYGAEFLRDPARIEVLVRGGFESKTPGPALMNVKQLLAQSDDPFRAAGHGTETVMIDPGHGGRDAGSRGRGGLLEKDATLAVARALGRALQREGFYAFMTRSSDSQVPDERRSELANLADADIFVSIQCGAWYSGWAGGFSVCYYEPPHSTARVGTVEQSRGLPRFETERASAATDDLMWGRLQENHIAESRELARAVRASMGEALPLRDRGVGRRSAGVLSGCDMPAIQIELGYITNRDEEALLTDEDFIGDAVRAIARGIAAYRSGVEKRNP
ncbi:MAG: N-acetylmuramoyl-L-alanine amidase [Candidatus Eisenbacteria bacterium]